MCILGDSARSHLCVWGDYSPVIRPLASIGGCQLIKMERGRPSRLITVKSFGAELGASRKRGQQPRPLASWEGRLALWIITST